MQKQLLGLGMQSIDANNWLDYYFDTNQSFIYSINQSLRFTGLKIALARRNHLHKNTEWGMVNQRQERWSASRHPSDPWNWTLSELQRRVEAVYFTARLNVQQKPLSVWYDENVVDGPWSCALGGYMQLAAQRSLPQTSSGNRGTAFTPWWE